MPLQMLPSPHDASERHCGVVGVVVEVVGVVGVTVVVVAAAVVVVSGPTVVVVVLDVVVVGGGHTGGAGRGEEKSTGPFTMSQPPFPGPGAQPHQFPVASIRAGVVLSTPNGRFPVMLLLVAVATALTPAVLLDEADAGLRGRGYRVARECALRVDRVAEERDDQDTDVPGVDRVRVDGGVSLVQEDALETVVHEGIAAEGRGAVSKVVDTDVVGGDGVAHHGRSGCGPEDRKSVVQGNR